MNLGEFYLEGEGFALINLKFTSGLRFTWFYYSIGLLLTDLLIGKVIIKE